jgi:hypothetical protein
MITMHETRLARFRWSRSTQLKPGDSSYGHSASYRSQAVGRKNRLFIGSLRARVRNASLMSLVACVLRMDLDGGMSLESVLTHMLRGTAKTEEFVTRSVDRSASARRCESTANKSDAIRPIRPLCKLHGVGYVRSSAKANSTSERPSS